MDVWIRADASYEMGSGHVMRCMTLAEGLRQRGLDVGFLSRELPGNMNAFMERKGWTVRTLPYRDRRIMQEEEGTPHLSWLCEDPNVDSDQVLEIICNHSKPSWLIIDHYALDEHWETKARPYVDRIMVIDDLADRRHDCDYLLDQNEHRSKEVRYQGLVPNTCQLLLGPEYALLRPEFAARRNMIVPKTGIIKRLLVFFGGSDSYNLTGMAIRALIGLNWKHLYVDIVVGASNPFKQEIEAQCGRVPWMTYHCQVDDMAALIGQADFAFGAAGASVWERLCLGLPTAIVSLARNQEILLEGILDQELLFYMGPVADVSEYHFIQILQEIMTVEGICKLKRMSAAARSCVDGMGCQRVVSSMLGVGSEWNV